MTAHFYLNTNL